MQVLDMALKVWGLSCISIDSPDAGSAAQRPEDEQAFILNLQVDTPPPHTHTNHPAFARSTE